MKGTRQSGSTPPTTNADVRDQRHASHPTENGPQRKSAPGERDECCTFLHRCVLSDECHHVRDGTAKSNAA